MTCPFCRSQRVSFPTTQHGPLHLKSGPAYCLACGAHEERVALGGDPKNGTRSRWVKGGEEPGPDADEGERREGD